jgi:hypothetical protein
VLYEHGLSHRLIKPHCPEENRLMEWTNRRIEEALEGDNLTDYILHRGSSGFCPSDPMAQRAAIAQCPGLPAAGGLLP